MDELKLTPEDDAFISRLFGPRIDDAGLLAETTVPFGVDWRGPPSDATPAVEVLVANVVHKGLAGKQPIGWSLTRDGEWTRLQIRVWEPATVAA